MTLPGLDPYHSNLLQAALADGPEAAKAYRAWRRGLVLDDIDFTALRLLPLLVAVVDKYGIDEPELPRIAGASKQTWLDNMLRARVLTEVTGILRRADIQSLVLKGAALLARYPQLAAMRGSGDYDLLVRRGDAARTVQTLLDAGLQVEGIRADRFTQHDFDIIHGLHFVRDGAPDSVDVHWWPLPDWFDRGYVEEVFARAEPATLIGQRMFVPALADHLFLSTKRVTFDDQDEIVLRAVESTLLLRGSRGELDWDRFVLLAQSHDSAPQSLAILNVIRSVGHAPVPDEVIRRLGEIASQIAPAPVASTDREHADLRALWHEHGGRAIDFSESPVVYLEGFSVPEQQGRWTNGKFAAMAVRVGSRVNSQVQVELEVRPFFPPGAQRFVFEAYGGTDLLRFELSRQDPFPCFISIPARVHGKDEAAAIVAFSLIDAASPKSIGLSVDPRRLGLMIDRVDCRWR